MANSLNRAGGLFCFPHFPRQELRQELRQAAARSDPAEARLGPMVSARHAQLIEELEGKTARSYLEEVLLACLLPLRDGGPTEWDAVTVHDAWATDRYLAVIYTSPWGPKVGVVHTRESLACEDPVDAGRDLANFSIAEPLGTVMAHLRYDADGMGWFGDLPETGGFPVRPAPPRSG